MRGIIDVRRFGLLLLTLIVCLFAPAVFAADAPPAVTDTSAAGLAIALIGTVGGAAIPLVVLGVKRVLPNIPRILLPTLVIPTLGVLAGYVGTIASGDELAGTVGGAIAALGSLYLRETWDTAKKHGTDPIPDPDDPFAR
jgi:hypothetical protein